MTSFDPDILLNEDTAASDDIIRAEAGPEDAGTRLDAFIGCNTEDLSRSYAVRLIEQGRFRIPSTEGPGESASCRGAARSRPFSGFPQKGTGQ